VGSLEPDTLRGALNASVAALLHQGADAELPTAATVSERLTDLAVDAD